MRRKYFFGIMMALLFLASTDSQAQRHEKKDEQFRQIVSLIEGRNYKFEVQNIQPTGGRSIRPSSIYLMKVNDGIFEAHLPYFGRAYQASFSGDAGITFHGEGENQNLTKNEKKRNLVLKFDIKGENDRYNIIFTIGFSGYATLAVNSSKRQPISYYGMVSPIEDK